jgi:hypothetical protein
MGGMQIRLARGEEAAAITALGLRSKAHWGYDEAFIARCASELRWDEDDLHTMLVHVAERDGTLLGFCAVNPAAAPPELGALFIEPDAMGAGAGRAARAGARRGGRVWHRGAGDRRRSAGGGRPCRLSRCRVCQHVTRRA